MRYYWSLFSEGQSSISTTSIQSIHMSQAYVHTQPIAPLIHKCDVWTDPFSFLQVQRCASGQLQCQRGWRGEVSPTFSGEAKQLRRAFPIFLFSTEWWIQFSYMVLAHENTWRVCIAHWDFSKWGTPQMFLFRRKLSHLRILRHTHKYLYDLQSND